MEQRPGTGALRDRDGHIRAQQLPAALWLRWAGPETTGSTAGLAQVPRSQGRVGAAGRTLAPGRGACARRGVLTLCPSSLEEVILAEDEADVEQRHPFDGNCSPPSWRRPGGGQPGLGMRDLVLRGRQGWVRVQGVAGANVRPGQRSEGREWRDPASRRSGGTSAGRPLPGLLSAGTALPGRCPPLVAPNHTPGVRRQSRQGDGF